MKNVSKDTITVAQLLDMLSNLSFEVKDSMISSISMGHELEALEKDIFNRFNSPMLQIAITELLSIQETLFETRSIYLKAGLSHDFADAYYRLYESGDCK